MRYLVSQFYFYRIEKHFFRKYNIQASSLTQVISLSSARVESDRISGGSTSSLFIENPKQMTILLDT